MHPRFSFLWDGGRIVLKFAVVRDQLAWPLTQVKDGVHRLVRTRVPTRSIPRESAGRLDGRIDAKILFTNVPNNETIHIIISTHTIT